jgi:hypothetical protein
VGASCVGGADVVFPWPSEAGHDAAIVAFVQNAQTGDVLQGLALPLTRLRCHRRHCCRSARQRSTDDLC